MVIRADTVYCIWASPNKKVSSNMRKSAQILIHLAHAKSLIRDLLYIDTIYNDQ